MAEELKIYEQASLTVDGSLLAECTDVSWNYADTDSVVHIMGGYYAYPDTGFSALVPGARYVDAQFTNLLPVNAIEYDFISDYLSGKLVTIALTFFGSGSRVTSQGFFRNPQFKTAVGSNALHAVSFFGNANQWSF